jgi:hypothetical protein
MSKHTKRECLIIEQFHSVALSSRHSAIGYERVLHQI